MIFEWEENKNRENYKKHKINFELAKEVFTDPLVEYLFDRVVGDEERWQAIGQVKANFLVVVVHCYRTIKDEEVIRII